MKNLSYLACLLLILSACSSQKSVNKVAEPVSEQEYYLAFTEATKYTMLGNYKGDIESYKRAIQLYHLCTQNFPEKAAPYYQISNIYLNVNDLEKARYYGIKAVERNDTNKWYLLHLANIYQYEQKVDSLVILYEKIVKVSNSPEYRYNLALFYNIQGNYTKSAEIVEALESELEGSKELYIIRHRNYAGSKKEDLAIKELENLIVLFPDQFEYYGMLAEYLTEISRYEQSKEVYKKLLLKDPDNGLANLSYGDFFLRQGDKDSALYYYERGFKADDIPLTDKIGIIYNYMYEGQTVEQDTVFIPSLLKVLTDKYTDHRPYTLAAEYYIKVKKYDTAVVQLKEAMDKGADTYIVWEQYIMLSNFLGKHEEVKNVYEVAIDKFPNEINLYIFAGYSLYLLNEYEPIVDFSEKALEIEVVEKDQTIQFLNILADAYRGLELLEKSDSIYEEILIIEPDNLLIRNNYSYYLSVRGVELERAEELSRLTIKKEPKNATYLDTYGWILYKMGRVEDALKYIEAAIKNGAYNSAEVLDHYGDIMFDLGRCKEAIEAWNEALKYDEERKSEFTEKVLKAEKNCNE